LADLADHLFRWEDLDQRLLSPKVEELTTEMQERAVEGERSAQLDTGQRGNSGGYLPRLLDFHEDLTNEWIKRLYEVHCEAWKEQNRSVTPAFVRAFRDRAAIPMIAVRQSTVQSHISRRGTLIRQTPDAVAVGECSRRMHKLAKRWHSKLEAEAVALEYCISKDQQASRYPLAEHNAEPLSVEPATYAGTSVSRRQQRPVDRRKELIARLKARNPDAGARKICDLIDQSINKEAPINQRHLAPLESWQKQAPTKRSWVEFFTDTKTHNLVRSYVNKVPRLKTAKSQK
jgi:hypothetical protein